VSYLGLSVPPNLCTESAEWLSLEGERRHFNQKIKEGPKVNGKFAYVDYKISLPPRSLNSFSQWVYRFMSNAQVLSPPELAEKHETAAKGLYARYPAKEKD
jgi:hypothetical protein